LWLSQHPSTSHGGYNTLPKWALKNLGNTLFLQRPIIHTLSGLVSRVLFYLSKSDLSTLVLHPCLRSHWFAAAAKLDMQEEAISNAEVAFRYIAETYLERTTPLAVGPASKPASVAPPEIRTLSFLASACSFQRPVTATSSTTIVKRTPQEKLADELDRYFRFEAAPMEQQEGHLTNELTAQEVLLNPLIWWKVSHVCYLCLSNTNFSY
jgi:hypothetical protein